MAISEQLDTAYVFLTSINGGGYIGVKSAPLSGSEAFKFRGAADDTIQRGTPFIQSATETLIDDPSTTKQNVTAASGIVVLANNLTKVGTTNAKYYLHNKMTLAADRSLRTLGHDRDRQRSGRHDDGRGHRERSGDRRRAAA